MIASIFRTARTMLPGFQPLIASRTRLIFHPPVWPTTPKQMSQRKVDFVPRRGMGNWPVFPDGGDKHPDCVHSSQTLFVVPNYNFSQEREQLMLVSLDLQRTNAYKHIRIEQGAIIGSNEWVHQLLTQIEESGNQKIDIVARTNAYSVAGRIEWNEPALSKIKIDGSCLKDVHGRPEELRMSQVKLTKKMIEVLADLMTASSHGVVFELMIGK